MTNIKRILSATLAYVIIASSLTPAYATNIVDQSDRIGNTIESSISVTLDTEEDLTENRNESIYTISFVDGDCGRIDDKTPVETGTNGIIESLPATCPDDGYEFEKWVTIPDGNEVKSGDSLHLDITIKPIFKLIEKDSETDREENGELSSTCPHGKMQGDECSECGQLVSSDKNIPLLGYTQNYFDSIHCDEEEYCLLSIRMVCPHGVADGVYCCECDEVVDIQSSDVPTCLILDSCIHGKVKGEKCPDCRELKEQQGDYKPIEGEEWDDPLIYEVESTSTSSSAYYDRGDMYWYCLWCDDGGKQGSHSGATILDDRHNVQYHTKHGSCNGWSTVTGYTMSGDCNSHTVERKWACGYSDSRGTHTKSNNCIYNASTSEKVTSNPTCTASGKKTVTTSYGSGCTKCGTRKSSSSYDSTISALNHIVSNYQYSNSDQHIPHCSGNNRSAHDLSATNHTWSTSGENQQCSANGCTAKKTKVHVDAYKLENGEPVLLQNDIETVTWVEVGNNGPASVNASDYLAKAPTITGYTLMETQPQDNTTEVNVAEGGIHLAIYYTLKNFPKYIVSIEAKDYQSEYTRGEDFSTKGTLILHYNDGTTGEVPMRESYIAPDTFPVSQNQPLGEMPVSVLYNITPEGQSVDTEALKTTTIRNLLNNSGFSARNGKLVYMIAEKEYETTLTSVNPIVSTIVNAINKDIGSNFVSLSAKDGSFIAQNETGMRVPFVPVSDLSKLIAGEIATLYKHTDLCTTYNVEIVDNKKEIESIKVKNPTTEYYLSDPFDNRGEIEVRYTDGTTETIPLKSEYLKDFSTSELGNKPVHVEYKGMTDEYTIKVKPHELSLDVVQLGDTTSWVPKAEAEITYAGDADYLVYPNGEKDHDLDGNKKTYPITANGEYPFKLIGKDGSEIEKILKVENVDGEGPTYQLSVKNHALYIKTQDNLSGIKKITFPNGTMTEIVKPELGVKKPLTFVYNIKDLAEGVYPIQISDHAGNVTFIELEIPIDPEKIPVEGGTAEEPDEGSYKYTVTYHYDDQDTEVIEGYGKVGEKIPYDDSSPLIYNGHNYVLESYKVANEITRKEAENIVELYYTVDDKDELGNDNPDGIPDKYQSSLEDLLEKYNYKVNYTYLSENGIATFTMDSAGNYQLDGEETVSGLANVGAAIPFSMTSTRNYKSRQYGLAEIDVKSTVVTPVEDNNIVNLVYLFEEELEKPTIDKPIIENTTSTSIEVKPIEDGEYSIDDGKSWQDSPIFDGLKPDTEYEIIQRIPDPDNEGEYIVSDPTTATTDPDDSGNHGTHEVPPPVIKDTTPTSIEVKPIEDGEYSIDDGETWQDEPIFEGLAPDTEYEIIQRIPDPDHEGEYIVSEPTQSKTDSRIYSIHSPIVTNTTQTSITIKPIENGEYSINNGKTWQEQITFVGLRPNTRYKIIQRVPHPDFEGEYIVSDSTYGITDPRPIENSTKGIPAPIIKGTTTESIKVKSIEDGEYSIDGGRTWQDSPIFDGLEPNTEYEIIQRIPDPYSKGDYIVSRPTRATTDKRRFVSSNQENSNKRADNKNNTGDIPAQILNKKDHISYIAGYVDGTVRPEANIKRGEVAAIIYRLMMPEYRNINAGTMKRFSDGNNIWCSQEIMTTAAAGIISGYPDGSFRPNNNITRGEFAVIVSKFFDGNGVYNGILTDIHGHWAEQYIQRAFAANFISGYPDNTFRPDAFITRAEAVSIINRLLGRRPNISGMISTMKTWPDNMPGVWYYEAMQEATNTHEYVMNDDGEQWSVISDQ